MGSGAKAPQKPAERRLLGAALSGSQPGFFGRGAVDTTGAGTVEWRFAEGVYPCDGLFWLVVCAAALSSPTLAKAVTIDFEDQSGPSSGGSPQSLTYTFGSLSVLIRGGTIHTNEATGQDKTSVFATAVTNLMAITFSAPVENFSVEVVNALAGTYGSANTEGIPLALFTIPETDGAAYTITWPSVENPFLHGHAARWPLPLGNRQHFVRCDDGRTRAIDMDDAFARICRAWICFTPPSQATSDHCRLMRDRCHASRGNSSGPTTSAGYSTRTGQ
jgi:hypothetical protein